MSEFILCWQAIKYDEKIGNYNLLINHNMSNRTQTPIPVELSGQDMLETVVFAIEHFSRSIHILGFLRHSFLANSIKMHQFNIINNHSYHFRSN